MSANAVTKTSAQQIKQKLVIIPVHAADAFAARVISHDSVDSVPVPVSSADYLVDFVQGMNTTMIVYSMGGF